MGYDFNGYKTKTSDELIADVMCPYAWEPIFKKYLGFEPQDLSGRVTLKNTDFIIDSIYKLIKAVEENEIEQFRGNLANCSKEQMLKDFKAIIFGVFNRSIRYLSVM